MKKIIDHFSNYWFVYFTFFFVILVLAFCVYMDYAHPQKSDYQRVQEYRAKEGYDEYDSDDLVIDYIGESDSYTQEDLFEAYNAGLSNGIEQTIEYYESLED